MKYGVVYDPFKQELFSASRGDGATLNNRRIRVSRSSSLESALIGTGFPFRNSDHVTLFLNQFGTFAGKIGDLRRAGAASLDLARR